MAARGQIYFPKTLLPPKSAKSHRCVVLSNTNLISTSGKNIFVMVAIIRSATPQARPVPGHSILLAANTIKTLPFDSWIETHQLFALSIQEFQGLSPEGSLPKEILEQVLAGCRRLFM